MASRCVWTFACAFFWVDKADTRGSWDEETNIDECGWGWIGLAKSTARGSATGKRTISLQMSTDTERARGFYSISATGLTVKVATTSLMYSKYQHHTRPRCPRVRHHEQLGFTAWQTLLSCCLHCSTNGTSRAKTADDARGGNTEEKWRKQQIAVRHLDAIDELITTMEAEGRRGMNAPRAAFSQWTREVANRGESSSSANRDILRWSRGARPCHTRIALLSPPTIPKGCRN
jgi:hypothetical protein